MTWDTRDIGPAPPPPPPPADADPEASLVYTSVSVPTYAQAQHAQDAALLVPHQRSPAEEGAIMQSGLCPGFIPARPWGLFQLWATRGIAALRQPAAEEGT